jgi:uncharacterized protein
VDELTTSRAAETEARIEALRNTYAAINRNDIPAAVAILDPEIEWIEPSESPEGGTTRGLADVEALHSRSLANWAEGGCEPERFTVAGDKIIALVHVRVRLKDNADWLDGRLADVYTFRNGKVIQKRTFFEPQQAFDWVGVDAPEAT